MSDTTIDSAKGLTTPDGKPLKVSLAKALRRQKIRSLVLIAPLLLFVLISFAAPIADMLFRSVENGIVPDTLPRTVVALEAWDPDSGEAPGDAVFAALRDDLMIASERKNHTRLGSRLNYEMTGMSSLFRKTGRRVDDFGEIYTEQFESLNDAWAEPATWVAMMASENWIEKQANWAAQGENVGPEPSFELNPAAEEALPRTADIYGAFADVIQSEDQDSPTQEEPWNPVYAALYDDLMANPDAASAFSGATAELISTAAAAVPSFESVSAKTLFIEADDDWNSVDVWRTISAFSGPYTAGYYLTALDAERTAEGIELKPEGQRIYLQLFMRTLILSIGITFSCLLLGYPVAFLLSHLPLRKANLLMILVLLPFWTSLLVRTSSWKVLLQQQGVINDALVYIGIVPDEARLALINNATGTIIAMTHILLPFMILPLYSVMKTISPNYVRAAKSLGATDWTAFWRIYFPQTVPGIGAGAVLVFILSIGYYITPELVGGTSGIFISNRIAYHISSSLNWGLAAALGTLLLLVVMLCFVIYDKVIGLDNVKLG